MKPKYKYKVGDRVRHFEHTHIHGTISGLTTNFGVNEDLSDYHHDYPWYKIQWDGGGWEGQECEDSLTLVV